MMATEQSCKRHLTHIDFEEGEEVLETNWLHKNLPKKDNIIVEKNL